MDIGDLDSGVSAEAQRGRVIWGVTAEYAFYSPVHLPATHLGEPFRLYRTPTRGWYFYGGFVQDDEVFGSRRVVQNDIYAGTRLAGPGNYDITLQGTYYTNRTIVEGDDRIVTLPDGSQFERPTPEGSSHVRNTLVINRLLVNPDATPGVNDSYAGFAPDALNLVFPIHWDVRVAGLNDYENVRVGAELWWKVFGTGLGGTTFLPTIGYNYQYFYNIKKAFHNVQATFRMGWGDL
jgi:hypothetical protein